MKTLTIVVLLAAAVVAPRADAARNVFVSNYCPFALNLVVYGVNQPPLEYRLARRDAVWLKDRHGALLKTSGREVAFNARPRDGTEDLLWQGQQVHFEASKGWHVYRDTWADVDVDFCDEPNSLFLFSFSSGGDAVFPAGCGDDRASHIRFFTGGGLTECPVRVAGVATLLTVGAVISNLRSSRQASDASDRPSVPTYIEMDDPRTGTALRLRFKWGD